ncbi:MAG: Asp-tRNA(Asn)/Glu-tRNA(Gln) amidotransferase subunit GatB [Syntrophobacteraceae bacterium]
MDYEAVIGLEIHAQLNCRTKMFCPCPNQPGDEPNRNTCPICLWLPGNLPRFSREALEKATLASLALNCEIQRESAFDQKVYYYPDLPKGYQLSQFHLPLAKNGWLDITDLQSLPKRLRIQKIHMEEDVAKLVHEQEGRTPVSLVDFNRAGAPLVEIVTEPDMRSPHHAMEFLRRLRMQLRYSGSSDCSMEQGTMRVDANISIRTRGSGQLNTKVEIKNMNSIRHVGDAIAYEITRQVNAVLAGETIVLHTRLWDPDNRITTAMRGKFEGPCIPDPSVPRIVIDDVWLEEMRRTLPEMPDIKAVRFGEQYGLTGEDASIISSERDLSEYFEAVAAHRVSPRLAAQWIAVQFLPLLKERNQLLAESTVAPKRFADLLFLLEREEINANAAKDVLKKLMDSTASPEEIVTEFGYRQVSEAADLEAIVNRVLAENPSAVENFRKGASKAMGFLMGQAMQASGGKAHPRLLKEIMARKVQ